MNLEIETKFKSVKMKKVFYAGLFRKTGTSVGTIRSHWFNLQQGIKIPPDHEKDVIEILNWSLSYESKIKEINAMYGI